jgi:hypothetical protein
VGPARVSAFLLQTRASRNQAICGRSAGPSPIPEVESPFDHAGGPISHCLPSFLSSGRMGGGKKLKKIK